MKSAIFESINDRSNIANAYLRMVNEAREQEIEELVSQYADKDYPLCVYDWDSGDEMVIDLFDVKQKYKNPSYYEKGNDDYYISLAFEQLGDDELYKKILEWDNGFYVPPEQLSSLQNGFLNTVKDLDAALRDIGKEIEDELHEDEYAVEIPKWADKYLNADNPEDLIHAGVVNSDDVEMPKDYLKQIESQGYELVYDGEKLGFCSQPEFGPACDCIKYYLVRGMNESVDGAGNEWFDSVGILIKKLPRQCIIDCATPGRDATHYCQRWVDKLHFADGLDIPLAKGYLKYTGGWTDDEIAAFDDNEVANIILWLVANDIRDGQITVSIGEGGRFDDGSSTLTESRYHSHKVVLTNIQWPDAAYDRMESPPAQDSMIIEVGDGENLEKAIHNIYFDSYGIKPVRFRIAKDVNLGSANVDDVKKPRRSRKDEMVSQTDLDKFKKKHPKMKDISEER